MQNQLVSRLFVKMGQRTELEISFFSQYNFYMLIDERTRQLTLQNVLACFVFFYFSLKE